MKKTGLLLSAILVFMFIPGLAKADVSVNLRLDRAEATLMDTVRMVVSVSGTRKIESEPTLNGLEEFSVTKGGTSSRFEIVNGSINSGVEITYLIQPRKTGTFRIGPAEVKVDGEKFSSNTQVLTVLKANVAKGSGQGPVFLTAALSSTRAYVGEQVLYTLKLYRQVKVSDISLDLAATEQLTFKQLGKPFEYQSVYDGRTYQVLEIRYVLIPSKEGAYGIKPSTMRLMVYEPRRGSRPRGLFQDPFFGDRFSSGQPRAVTSQALDLTVIPLPTTGRPAGFSGLVGSFEIESRLEPTTIKAGESATLTVRLKGRGNVNNIPDLKGPDLSHAKVYADQPVLEIEPDAKGLSGQKIMKWAIVPEKEGLYHIQPLCVSFFDTENHQYREINTPRLSLSVLPGQPEKIQASTYPAETDAAGGPSKQEVKELGSDILPIHTSLRVLTSRAWTRPEGLFLWLVLLVPFLVYTAIFLGIRFRNRSARSLGAVRAKKAAKILIRQCHHKGLGSSDLVQCIRIYLNERFGLSLGSLTPGEAYEVLRSKGVKHDRAQELREMLKRVENDIYTGRGQERCDTAQDIPKLVKQIEKEIR